MAISRIPTALRMTLMICGTLKTIEWINQFGSWFRGWFPQNSRVAKADRAAGLVFQNGVHHDPYAHISGLLSAFWFCPWPWSEGGLVCYQTGWRKNPVIETVITVWKPIRFFGNAGFCMGETGVINKMACAIGLEEEDKVVLEERIQLLCLFILLVGACYVTQPKKKRKKNEEV